MANGGHRHPDRLSSQTVHALLTLLTAIRAQEHMVRRWVRLRDASAGYERVLERLALTDAWIGHLAAELVARATDGDEEATGTP